MGDQLDNEVFTCCKCGGSFNHIDGTWLPVGEEVVDFVVTKEPVAENEQKMTAIQLNGWRPPEIITSDDFTCYSCL